MEEESEQIRSRIANANVLLKYFKIFQFSYFEKKLH